MDGATPIRIAGIELPAEERTPLVERLLRMIEEQRAEIRALRDEIARLKGLPPRPTIRPSTLNAPHPDPGHKRRRRGKRPGSEKRHKTGELMIHETIPLPLEGLPEGTQQNGYEDFVAQDLTVSSEPRHPAAVARRVVGTGHRRFDRPDRPSVDRRPRGVPRGEGRLAAGGAGSVALLSDRRDTSARHLGKNAYTTVIANPLFASFNTTASKSRVNFLELLAAPHREYVWGADALAYVKSQGQELSLERPSTAPATRFWKYYQRLRTYRELPTPPRKTALQRDFDRLFTRRTGYADLNEALGRIHGKRDDLLLVLDHPEIPLHNNLSESDIREWAKKRKISAGTRSELGRRCRDTFISLKKTCRKLGVSFWRYLQDRIRGVHDIVSLPELMRQAVRQT